jgi:hypothetical protein
VNQHRVDVARGSALILLCVGGAATAVGLLLGIPVLLVDAADSGSGATAFGLAVLAMLLGLGWMWWIYRSPARFDESAWRYRDGRGRRR